ncbi:uncharacterized protein LOC132471191 isoform X1 [Gadus macrocephalus]|uniref:uncharacterized protein LOC132471191 isoform X1 n=1 Tax=Gadus macrocephalus TaxID=80720 RepID=UPI0028CBB661|nr:uncharacterized protein LOC132471191 isoform X1 [Gadus macrocephalus]
MSRRHARCSVVGCKDDHKSLHRVPAAEDRRAAWIDFIFEGQVPATVGKNLLVCARHFKTDCFSNLGQYTAELAGKLFLNEGALPTLRGVPADERHAIASVQLPATRDIGCQTEPPQRRSVGTQLSLKTLHSHYRSAAVQATVSCKNFGTSTGPFTHSLPLQRPRSIKQPYKRPRLEQEEFEEEEDSLEGCSILASQGLEATYDSEDSVTALTESTVMSDAESTSKHEIRKYIVYETCLMELFDVCAVCKCVCAVKTKRLGTFISVEQLCEYCEYSRIWKSQPLLDNTPAGNLQLSAAVYISGASFFKLQRVFKAMHLQIFLSDTFRRHARMFIEPAIVHKWKNSQELMLQQLSEESKVILCGDMRADSPGHCAKFGIYTMMALNTNTVVDLQLVQSNEVGGSSHMEQEGLKRSLELFGARGVTLDCIVTDSHPQIQRFLRENNITQFYDVWHMEKGISKQLHKISKTKDCQKVKKWMRAIRNHVHWTAESSKTGPERLAKWTSLLNHVQDIHTHDDPLFPKCLHAIRSTRDKSKWLSAATPAFYKLEKALTKKTVLRDIAKLSPHHQTSSLDAFHALILQFAPKNVIYPYLGILCRHYLAALHYNENADRGQATTSSWDPIYSLSFPKTRKGECRAKPVKTEATFRYVDDLMDMIMENVFVDPSSYRAEILKMNIPPDPSSEYEHQNEEEAKFL